MAENKKQKSSLFSGFNLGDEKNYFIENLAMLLASGMDILSALDGIKDEFKSAKMKKIIINLRDDIENGSSLWRSLAKTKLFSSQTLSLIKIGEQSGRLSENLAVINTQQKKERIFKSKIRSAMMYPVFVLVLMIVVGSAIAWFILPRLTTVFSQLDMELPIITQMLIKVGNFLGSYGTFIVPGFILFILLLIYFTFVYSKTKHIGQWLLFRMPLIKNLIQQVELARFGYILGTLLEAGLSITDSLKALEESTSFREYKNLYKHLQSEISLGKSFNASFKSFKSINVLIPKTIQQMIVFGTQSGSLSKVFLDIGENFEQKTDNTTKNLTVVLEPFMLIIVWIGVVGVAMAVILPIYSLIGGLNR